MAKNNALVDAFCKGFEEGRRTFRLRKIRIMQQQYLDRSLIALGELGMDPDFLAEFQDKLEKVTDSYNEEWLADTADLDYATARIDRILKQYVRPDRFVPARERYELR